jgi:ubiquinone/menaquinone biosynthesis C-methylase UbiE
MGYEVYGIASEHEPIKNKNVSILNIETDRFPYKDNTFDMVLCSEVLEHLPHSPAPALAEMYRVTKNGGQVLITTPNITRSINQGKMLLGKSPIPLAATATSIYHRHNHEYTLAELSQTVRHGGWTIEKATHFISYTPFRRRNRTDHPLLRAGKFANYLAMRAIPRLADTLLVIGKKSV